MQTNTTDKFGVKCCLTFERRSALIHLRNILPQAALNNTK